MGSFKGPKVYLESYWNKQKGTKKIGRFLANKWWYFNSNPSFRFIKVSKNKEQNVFGLTAQINTLNREIYSRISSCRYILISFIGLSRQTQLSQPPFFCSAKHYAIQLKNY